VSLTTTLFGIPVSATSSVVADIKVKVNNAQPQGAKQLRRVTMQKQQEHIEESSEIDAVSDIKKHIVTDMQQLMQRCEPCESYEEGIEIGEQLIAACKVLSKDKGLICQGLAANQLGFNKRVIVLLKGKRFQIWVNPVLIGGSAVRPSEEACYSQPGVEATVLRFSKVVVKADKRMKTTLNGLSAFCFQHEIDHLNGKLI
jgi:peptide deformylase